MACCGRCNLQTERGERRPERRNRTLKTIHTHYDNLKVTRNAPPEVIKAAYRVLAQKYHPDMNGGNPDATRVMGIINEAYETLKDPLRRAEHDAWIDREEALLRARAEAVPPAPPAPPPPATEQAKSASPAPATTTPRPPKTVVLGGRRDWALVLVAIVVMVMVGVVGQAVHEAREAGDSFPSVLNVGQSIAARPEFEAKWAEREAARTADYAARAAAPVPKTTVVSRYDQFQTAPRAVTAAPADPDAQLRAGVSRYLAPQEAQGGLSQVTLDNRGGEDCEVRLYYSGQRYAVRDVFVRAGDRFTMTGLAPSIYTLRWRAVGTQRITRLVTPVALYEDQVGSEARYSKLEFSLYRVASDNMHTTREADETF